MSQSQEPLALRFLSNSTSMIHFERLVSSSSIALTNDGNLFFIAKNNSMPAGKSSQLPAKDDAERESAQGSRLQI
jgi:hypothetical protein